MHGNSISGNRAGVRALVFPRSSARAMEKVLVHSAVSVRGTILRERDTTNFNPAKVTRRKRAGDGRDCIQISVHHGQQLFCYTVAFVASRSKVPQCVVLGALAKEFWDRW